MSLFKLPKKSHTPSTNTRATSTQEKRDEDLKLLAQLEARYAQLEAQLQALIAKKAAIVAIIQAGNTTKARGAELNNIIQEITGVGDEIAALQSTIEMVRNRNDLPPMSGEDHDLQPAF